MKRFESLYLLEVRMCISKLLIFAAVMTAVYVVLLYCLGIPCASYGYDYAIAKAGFDKVTNISFFLCGLMYIVIVLAYREMPYRNRMLETYHPAELIGTSILTSFTLFVLWYAYTIADWTLVTFLFRIHPSYCGGPQGILYSLTISSIAREVIPFREPVGFLLNVLKFIPASLVVNVIIVLIILFGKKFKGDK